MSVNLVISCPSGMQKSAILQDTQGHGIYWFYQGFKIHESCMHPWTGKEIHISIVSLIWVEGFITIHRQLVSVESWFSRWVMVSSAVSRESVLGPLLYHIFVNELSRVFRSKCLLFTDELKPLREIRSPKDGQPPKQYVYALFWKMPNHVNAWKNSGNNLQHRWHPNFGCRCN